MGRGGERENGELKFIRQILFFFFGYLIELFFLTNFLFFYFYTVCTIVLTKTKSDFAVIVCSVITGGFI